MCVCLFHHLSTFGARSDPRPRALWKVEAALLDFRLKNTAVCVCSRQRVCLHTSLQADVLATVTLDESLWCQGNIIKAEFFRKTQLPGQMWEQLQDVAIQGLLQQPGVSE